jgi:hypothetical protein
MIGMWIANVLVQVNFADEGIKISETSVTSPKILEPFFVITSPECRVIQKEKHISEARNSGRVILISNS